MTTLIQFILVHYAFILVGEKYNARGELRKLSKKRDTKVIYDITECLLCYTHTVGVLILPFLIMSNGFKLEYLIYPLMSTGALFMINKQKA